MKSLKDAYPKIVIRADSSNKIGTGHVMRCLTMALRMKDFANIFFICREYEGHMSAAAERYGFKLIKLPRMESDIDFDLHLLPENQEADADQVKAFLSGMNIDCIVVDHYGLDVVWERKMRMVCSQIMVIDDLANRHHDCDVLLDQNYYRNMDKRYLGLVPEKCKLFLGPRFVLLREEFYKKSARIREGKIERILVFFGGNDYFNETLKALRGILMIDEFSFQIDVVIGKNNMHRNVVADFCAPYSNIRFFCQVDTMAELIDQADLAIGAGGTHTWERCFRGLPALVVTTAENQQESVRMCHEDENILIYLGPRETVTPKQIAEAVLDFATNPEKCKETSRNCIQFMQGNVYGLMQAIILNKIDQCVALQEFDLECVDRTYNWVIQEEHKKLFLSKGPASREENKRYWNNELKKYNNRVFAIYFENCHIGNCGLKNLEDQRAELWIYIGDPTYKGHGIGKAALVILLQKAFHQLGISSIYLHVAKFNLPAIRLYENAGFIRIDGIDAVWQGQDVIRMELKR